MDLSILIVNYRTYTFTKQTIDSVQQTVHNIGYEIIIVDNNSGDGSYEQLKDDFKEFENIKFVLNHSNDGFAVANNIAFKNSSGKYILLLNSDVFVHENTINESFIYLKNHEKIGILGCKVLLPNGELDKACRRSFPTFWVSFYRMTLLSRLFPNSPRFNKYNLSYMDDNGVYPVDCVVGAYMLLKSDLYGECGGLDESYFMYGEDIELCYDVKELGFEVCYYGKKEITHYKGASGGNKKLLYEFHKSMQIFYDKHYKKTDSIIKNMIVYLGIWTLYYIKLIILLIKSK